MACIAVRPGPGSTALRKRDRYNNVVIRSNQPAERRWDRRERSKRCGGISLIFLNLLSAHCYLSAAPHSEGDAIRSQMPRPDKLITRSDSFNIILCTSANMCVSCVCVCEQVIASFCLSLSSLSSVCGVQHLSARRLMYTRRSPYHANASQLEWKAIAIADWLR